MDRDDWTISWHDDWVMMWWSKDTLCTSYMEFYGSLYLTYKEYGDEISI
jgi:hypothetical protein